MQRLLSHIQRASLDGAPMRVQSETDDANTEKNRVAIDIKHLKLLTKDDQKARFLVGLR